ncbi:MAG TPA: hypothetical protein VMF52_14720 [Steroidobacteraceae bacterium]|nr:hypothetical protein [Steroidobacteraceae bacterium]
MSPIENHLDWTAASTPGGERVAPTLARAAAPAKPVQRRSVLETLLGDANLSASDAGGSDPYNATGRQFRRAR